MIAALWVVNANGPVGDHGANALYSATIAAHHAAIMLALG